MEYLNFLDKRAELHQEICKAIKDIMESYHITEIDLTTDSDTFDAGYLICSTDGAESTEEVMVRAIKINDVGNLSFQKVNASAWQDDDWYDLGIEGDVVWGTIDTVYDAVYQRI